MVSGSPIQRIRGAEAPRVPAGAPPTYLIIRADDGGMSHSVNMALERLMISGMPLSVSVIFAAPWYQETVEILKRHPDVAVGVHLALNSEWKNYRWGPVSGRSAVPTLVDSVGYFFASGEALYHHDPSLAEIEQELRALGADLPITFMPHLLPLDQGELVSCYVTPSAELSEDELVSLFDDAYAREPFVELRTGPVGVIDVRDTNYCRISWHQDPRTGRIIVFSAIDNLWKGAASQAVQNLNLMFDRPETEGLL
jgi:hypothetical protein